MLSLFMLFIGIAHADPIYDQITTNKPSINRAYAKQLSGLIQTESMVKGVNPHLVAAIFMQESSYRLSAKNCTNICHDYGLSQINRHTARRFGFDLKKLTTDLAYSVRAGIAVLADFKRMYGKKEAHWWTRYNTSKPSLRLIYRKRVGKWLRL